LSVTLAAHTINRRPLSGLTTDKSMGYCQRSLWDRTPSSIKTNQVVDNQRNVYCALAASYAHRRTIARLSSRWMTMRRTLMMRNVILATTVVLALMTVQTQSGQKKPLPADVGPGCVAWFDITTSDLPKSRDFYGKLFDWKFNPVQGTDQAVEIVSRGT